MVSKTPIYWEFRCSKPRKRGWQEAAFIEQAKWLADGRAAPVTLPRVEFLNPDRLLPFERAPEFRSARAKSESQPGRNGQPTPKFAYIRDTIGDNGQRKPARNTSLYDGRQRIFQEAA